VFSSFSQEKRRNCRMFSEAKYKKKLRNKLPYEAETPTTIWAHHVSRL